MSSNAYKCPSCGLVSTNDNLTSCRRCNSSIAQLDNGGSQGQVRTSVVSPNNNILKIIISFVVFVVVLCLAALVGIKGMIVSVVGLVYVVVALLIVIAVPSAVIAGVIYIFYRAGKVEEKQSQDLANANAAYQQALLELRTNPGNPMLRQKALEFGRYSCALSRKGKVTIYDELSIKNDIDAVTVYPQPPAYPQPQVPIMPPQVYPQSPHFYSNQQMPIAQPPQNPLAELENLRSRGLIDEGEYQRRRAILGQQGRR